METTNEVIIHVKDLNFQYKGSDKPALQQIEMQLTAGDRCLLVGPNGSGKSTLLRILAGKHLVSPSDCVELLGRQAFHDTRLNLERTHIDIDWGARTRYGCPLQADIPVHSLMKQLQEEYPDRRNELLELLRIDLNWRLHEVSEGQRRRIQIFLGLIRPFKILLLDDVAVSLDVVAREDLFHWLKRETMEKGSVIM
jgi:CCR4-NOT complex subunit CAF16